MKRVSLFLTFAVCLTSLTSCGLIGAVTRVGSSVLRMPASVLKALTEAEQAAPAPLIGGEEEDAIETARIATVPME